VSTAARFELVAGFVLGATLPRLSRVTCRGCSFTVRMVLRKQKASLGPYLLIHLRSAMNSRGQAVTSAHACLATCIDEATP